MIHTCIAYAPQEVDMNIGRVCNGLMERISDDDWACFIDHDSMMTTHDWYKLLERTVRSIEDEDLPIGLITAVTNRIGNAEQVVFDKTSQEAQNHDMHFHRRVGRKLMLEHASSLREAKSPVSGVVMLTPKRVWRKCGGFKDGFLGVDNDYDMKVRRAGFKTCIMDGLYVYHWYRADGQPIQGWGYPEEANLPPIDQVVCHAPFFESPAPRIGPARRWRLRDDSTAG